MASKPGFVQKQQFSKCSREFVFQPKNHSLGILGRFNPNSHVPTKFAHKRHSFGGPELQIAQKCHFSGITPKLMFFHHFKWFLRSVKSYIGHLSLEKKFTLCFGHFLGGSNASGASKLDSSWK